MASTPGKSSRPLIPSLPSQTSPLTQSPVNDPTAKSSKTGASASIANTTEKPGPHPAVHLNQRLVSTRLPTSKLPPTRTARLHLSLCIPPTTTSRILRTTTAGQGMRRQGVSRISRAIQLGARRLRVTHMLCQCPRPVQFLQRCCRT